MTKLWQAKDGRSLDPVTMETSHIINALNMLRRNGFVGPKTVRFYNTCQLPRGEMAQDAFDMEYDAVMDAPVSEFVDIFEAELERRNNGSPT